MERLYLGIDGGQSSTTALIADQSGRVLGRGVGGPCNHVSGDLARAKFINAVGDCLSAACAQAGIPKESLHFAAACLGFSGGAEDKETFARELIRSERWKITHDAEIALEGATGGQPGIVVISGTGSMAFGRNQAGQTARAGGWGYLFGDEGGALYLVKEALRASLRQEEGWGPQTALRDQFLRTTGAETMNQLLHRFYTISRSEIAGYAQLVDDAASSGDTIAAQIFHMAAAQLAHYVQGVHQQLFALSDACSISYVGGTFRSEHLRQGYIEHIRETTARQVMPPAMNPAAGALLVALRLDGNTRPLSNLTALEK